jgi:cytochrome c-type biogenesis protein CcmH/NrfG
LNKIIAKNPANSEAYVFKGQAFTKTKNYNDAILSYEQAIKYNTSKRATTKALH